MEVTRCGTSWFIEDFIDSNLLNSIEYFLENNLDSFYKYKEGYSTTGNNAEQYWIKNATINNNIFYLNDEYKKIENEFKNQVLRRLKKASLLRDNDIDLEHHASWTVVGEEGSYHTVHDHGRNINGVSTVLYVNVPDRLKNEKKHDNCLFLILHSNPLNIFIEDSAPGIFHVKPEKGKLLIFPFYIPHGTYPQTKGIRQTFNVEYLFKKSEIIVNYQ